jgi:hypothetical protein
MGKGPDSGAVRRGALETCSRKRPEMDAGADRSRYKENCELAL